MSPTTKDALATSLKSLLTKKSLDHITIKEITDNCGVSRQCFYYHFDDIYALVEWIYLEEAKRALSGHKTYDRWQQAFYRVFIAMLEQKELVQNTYRSMGRDYLENFMCDVLFGLVFYIVESLSEGMKVERGKKEFIARFYSFAFVAFGLDWIRRGMKEEPKDIIDQIGTLVEGDIYKALKKYEIT